MTLSLLQRWRRILVAAAIAVAMAGGWLTARPVPAGAAPAGTLTWSTLSPPLSPPPLAYATMAYDNDNSTVVLFGGQQADGTLSSDTWVWNGSTWTRYASAVPARKMASMAFDPALHQLILFGGQGGGNQLLNDTWAWNGASWVVETPGSGAGPTPREGASLGFDSNDQLVLFGGSGAAAATPFVSGGAGPQSAPASPSSAAPAAGAATAVLADANPLLTLGDTWVWTGSTWSQQAVGGPPARTDAAMAWDGAHHQTVLFGGSSSPVGATPPSGMVADTWIWGSGAWSPAAPPISPTPRQDTTVVADGDLGGLVAFGGGTTGGLGNDTWLWNGQTWAQLAPTASPSARQGAAAAYDAAAHQLILFGGVAGGGTVLGDTQILTAKAPAMPGATAAPSGPGSQRSAPTSTAGTATTPTTRGSNRTTGSAPGRSGTGVASTPSQQRSSARQVRPGDLVTLSGSGFKANTPIIITFHSTPYVVGRTVANGAGDFSATVAVPTAAAAGLHHFDATGMGESGVMITLVTPVDVVDAVIHHRTLVETLVLVTVAIALPVGTWLVMGISWRRRDVPVEA